MAITYEIDVTDKIGPMAAEIEWPMFSFVRPTHIVWNTIANVLHERGWSEAKIQDWLQSKEARWALDGALGDALTDAAEQYAREHIR
jgi:hypothetical protein